jgi:phenylpyruvate tautomerase PptA (4-oxalocrotonate tautomerase family)
MPLVRIDLAERPDDAALGALSDGIQNAMVQTIGVPADDRFHLIRTGSQRIYDRAYLGIARTDRTAFIEITLREGRTPQAKAALYEAVCANTARALGLEPGDVFVVLRENGAGDWSFGDGKMQYAHLLQPAAH